MKHSDNPFASPAEQGARNPSQFAVRRVRVVAIALIVQGALECVMGLMLLSFVFILMRIPPPRPGGGGQNAGLALAGGYYLVFGLGAGLVGGVRIFAGIRNLSFRNHTLGIVSLALGLVTLMTCYCAPSSVALAIYGLIIYLNPYVSEAFAMGERGATPDQVTEHFSLPR